MHHDRFRRLLMEAVALTFGILGFIFGLNATSQVNELKKELKRRNGNAGD